MTMTSNTSNHVVNETSATATDSEISPSINLKRIERGRITVTVEGTAGLIVRRWSEKAKEMMLATMQQAKTRTKREPRNPEADFESSMYRFSDGGHGFPAVAFKAAMVDSARLFDGVKMTELRPALHVLGEGPDQLVRLILNHDPRMREDSVRVGMGSADLRYRAEYSPWSADLVINFVPRLLSAESVIAIVDAAGLGGVGEWRPSKAKTGIYGTFQVAL